MFSTTNTMILLSSAINTESNESISAVEAATNDTSSLIQNSVSRFGFFEEGSIHVKLISILITVLVAFILCKITNRLLKKYIIDSENDKITGSHVTTANIVYNVLRFLLVLFTIIVILDIIGVNITGFIAGLGIVGAIGGLAMQDLLKDFIAGACIASEKYFAIGDYIECQGYTGCVTSLSMRSTKIRTYDGSIVTIQNHLIDKARLLSTSCIVQIPLSYDLERTKAYKLIDTITEEIKKIPSITYASSSGISEFADSSIKYCIVFNCATGVIPQTKRDVNVTIINELDKAGVEIPFNQLDIHQK